MKFDIWVAPATERTPLCTVMHHERCDKGGETGNEQHNYSRYYQKLFGPNRYEVKNLFELGVFQGASLRAWEKFFPNAEIYGADIERGCLFNSGRISTKYCDAKDPSSIQAMWAECDLLFDIMIDDGPHEYHANTDFLLASWERLRPGGVYIIEDLVHMDRRYDEAAEKIARRLDPADYRLLVIPHQNTYDNKLMILVKR